MLVFEFIEHFEKKLHEIVPEEAKRDLEKQKRTVKNTLYSLASDKERIREQDAIWLQERFHIRMDQLASDYRTWKRAGCKTYARPKQYISGPIARTSKRAFDTILNQLLLAIRKRRAKVSAPIEAFDAQEDINSAA